MSAEQPSAQSTRRFTPVEALAGRAFPSRSAYENALVFLRLTGVAVLADGYVVDIREGS